MAVYRSVAFLFVVIGLAAVAAGCNRKTPQPAPKQDKAAPSPRMARPDSAPRMVRATGTVQAVRTFTVRVPQLSQTSGQNVRLTLTALAPNGTSVKKDDILVEFDQTAQLDEAREAKAKLEDLEHQLEQQRAQSNSDATKRLAAIREAEVELGKAEIQLKKGPVLADLDRKRNEVKAASVRERLVSLNQSHQHRIAAETAAVRTLELKCERQKLVVQRIESNINKLTIKAPHDGMVALETVFRSGSMGPPQVGDQVWPNQPIIRIFDPSEMIVDAQVNEPDVAVLAGAAHAKVFLDAYPSVAFSAQLESASPVATAGLESPVKSFTARFRIGQRDPRLLPDLSASLEIETGGPQLNASAPTARAAGL